MSSLKNNINQVLNKIEIDFGGGCSLEKALVMAELIKFNNLKTSLDIGVYRGRSLLPQAIAHCNFSDGVVYGVDPYSNEEAKQFDRPEIQIHLDSFVKRTDFEAIFQEVSSMISNHGLQKNCILIRKRSDEAVVFFKDKGILFDLIHIDGNHDTKMVMNDVDLYAPLLKKNGFIVLDDISWKPVKPALQLLEKKMKKVLTMQNESNDFAVFWNGNSIKDLYKYKLYLKFITSKFN